MGRGTGGSGRGSGGGGSTQAASELDILIRARDTLRADIRAGANDSWRMQQLSRMNDEILRLRTARPQR